MYWNHRVIEFVDEYEDKWFSIHEVHYDENEKPTGFCEPFVGSETLEGLKEVVARMQEAVAQPVLKAKDFRKEVK